MELRSDISKNDISCALILLLQNKEYNKISIQNIVDRAGLSRMAYYRNFDSKDEILKYYLDKITDEFMIETKIDFDDMSFSEFMVTLFNHLVKWEDLGKLLLKNDLLYFVKQEFDRVFDKKAKTLEEKYRYGFVAGGLFNIYNQWLIQGCKITPESLAKIIGRYNFVQH